MQTEITNIGDETAIVEVIDERDNRHLVEVVFDDDGPKGRHGQDAYPGDSAERTDEQDRIMNQVVARARFEVHTRTDHDILLSGWDPRQLERGVEALESMPLDAFDDAFEEYYQTLRDPERLVDEYDLDCDPQQVTVHEVYKSFCIDDDNDVVEVLPIFAVYTVDDPDDGQTAGPDVPCPDGATRITPILPPFERLADDFTHPEDFRDLLISNLICQARDVYRNMGEEPPERFDIEGFGKPSGPLNFDG